MTKKFPFFRPTLEISSALLFPNFNANLFMQTGSCLQLELPEYVDPSNKSCSSVILLLSVMAVLYRS